MSLSPVPQNTARGFFIIAADASDPTKPLPGIAAQITASLSKSGGTSLPVGVTIVPRGKGYWVTPIAAHRDTFGESLWDFDAPGAVIASRREEVVAYDSQHADLGLSSLADLADGGRLDLLVDAIKTAVDNIDADLVITDATVEDLAVELDKVIKSGESFDATRGGETAAGVTHTRT